MSGTRDSWSPTVWPHDPQATEALQEYLSQATDLLYGIKLDFSGANLEGADLQSSWINGANFSQACLRSADLFAANATDVVFREADLTGANLGKAVLWRADFERAKLVRSSLVRVEAAKATFVNADISGAKLVAGDFTSANFTGADLRGSDLESAYLPEAVFVNTVLTDASGGVFGPVVVDLEPRVVLDGEELERWFAGKGASVRVYPRTEGVRP